MIELDESQRAAVALIASARFGVVTGGPGTGKTTCLKSALRELGPDVRVELASPTGKAARRMSEATDREARTVHRLLGYRPGLGFEHHAEAPLPCDLVIVDEASMLDVELAAALFAAIPDGARCVLVGDANQLPSVGPGRVFADLIESGAVPVVRLTTLHRSAAKRWVSSQAPRVLAGELPDLAARPDFAWHEHEDRDACFAAVVERAAATGAQVLVPQNIGPVGADRLNVAIRAAVNPPLRGAAGFSVGGDTVVHVGDRVIQTRNDYLRDVMNGETGRVFSLDREELAVLFEGHRAPTLYDRDAARGVRLAYALTIHKSQGSEWPAVIVVTHSTHARMLERSLVYTAITRARARVELVGNAAGLRRAVKQAPSGARNTRLRERLGGAA